MAVGKALGDGVTTRNWNTMVKLLALAGGGGPADGARPHTGEEALKDRVSRPDAVAPDQSGVQLVRLRAAAMPRSIWPLGPPPEALGPGGTLPAEAMSFPEDYGEADLIQLAEVVRDWSLDPPGAYLVRRAAVPPAEFSSADITRETSILRG